MTVLAASSGLRVEAMTEVTDRMMRMTSRFQRGQFYLHRQKARRKKCVSSYQRVIRVIAGLRHEDGGCCTAVVIFQSRIGGLAILRPRRIVVDKRSPWSPSDSTRTNIALSPQETSLPGTCSGRRGSSTPRPIPTDWAGRHCRETMEVGARLLLVIRISLSFEYDFSDRGRKIGT